MNVRYAFVLLIAFAAPLFGQVAEPASTAVSQPPAEEQSSAQVDVPSLAPMLVPPSEEAPAQTTDEPLTAVPSSRQFRIVSNAATANFLPKYVDSTGALTSSIVSEVNGMIGIGIATPLHSVHAYGTADSAVEIEAENANATGGTSASALFRTHSNTSSTSYISHGSGRTVFRFGQVVGGWSEILNYAGNGLLIGTNLATPVILGTNAQERMRIFANGHVSIGGPYDQGRFGALEYSDSGRALTALLHTTIEANTSQTETGTVLAGQESIPAGVTNSGSVTSVQVEGWNLGQGTIANLAGERILVGNHLAANGGIVTNAVGLVVSVVNGLGSITNGYGIYIGDTYAANDYGLYQTGADDDNYFAGRVGIGTSTPADMLHVTAPSNFGIRLTHTDPTSSQNSISFYEGTALMGFVNQRGSAYSGGARRFNLGNNDSAGDTAVYAGANLRMLVLANGNVGIGITAPTAKLHVGGDIVATGNIVTTGSITGGTVIGAVYQDVAEWVPSSDDLAPGTVVILDKRTGNTVTASHKAYDTLVAGVVSAQPGILLGIGAPTKEQIATTGRVKVRVDASNGPIEIGDLLVTSDVTGTAMKSTPLDLGGVAIHRPGTIIGKALEPLKEGAGEILLLLSLQ